MKKSNYLVELQQRRSTNKFNIIYQSIITGVMNDSYKSIHTNINKHNISLDLIMQSIQKPEYIICQSTNRVILLQQAIFMQQSELIMEGILDKVNQKISKLIQKIKTGIQNVLSKSSEVIKSFFEKLKENAVIAAIRKKLKIDDKVKAENFKSFFKISKNKNTEKAAKEQSNIKEQSIYVADLNQIITEATTLSKAQLAMNTTDQIKQRIQKYKDTIQR